MSVYASTPAFAERRRSPKALLLIVGAHAVLITAVMTAKMAVPIFQPDPPIKIIPIKPQPEPPPPNPPKAETQDVPRPPDSRPYTPPKNVPVPSDDLTGVDTSDIPSPPDLGPIAGTSPDIGQYVPQPIPAVVRTGPRFATPSDRIEPPYPLDKRRAEEEATLRLRISIDDRGRVVAVDPVGKADRSFLEAARRHLIANWRYKPAMEDGQAIASSTVITLTFRIE